jgi:hypothetical protein
VDAAEPVTTSYLRLNWGTAYEFTTGPGGSLTATPRRPGNDVLTAPDPASLLTLIRRSYRRPPPGEPPSP